MSLIGCRGDSNKTGYEISSPDGRITISFRLRSGRPYYSVYRDGKRIVDPSRLGLVFEDGVSLVDNLSVEDVETSEFDATWEQPWGEVRFIRNHYRELRVRLVDGAEPRNRMDVAFRAFDDGIGFRYGLPEQPNLGSFEIMDEVTEFDLCGTAKAWWIPAYRYQRYEHLFRESSLAKIDTVHTPLTVEMGNGLFLSIHEAALTDYASMTLMRTSESRLECDLVPWSDGVKVRGKTPHMSPWRTIQIADDPAGLVTSYLILNLNEPNALEDVSWIKPIKYVGIWWGMHIDSYTWGQGPNHGATTENTKRTIDFAARHGFTGVLVEGWNVGWDGDWGDGGTAFRFTDPYPDFDIEALSAYARRRGVQLIGHHETGGGIQNYERQMEEAFALYQRLGIRAVKTGYVAHGQGIRRLDDDGHLLGMEWHHGQWMVNHYRKAVKTAAEHGIMLDVHEPIKDTGIRRTFPNMLTREGARGQEWNAWDPDGGNTPEYTTILPFTRMLSGPFDFTPGIFDIFIENKPDNRVNTTLAKQLALYVVIYNPLQMAADLPENYEGHPAFRFIEDVPCDWEETRVLHAKIGDYVTFVRKDRNSADWYLGSITDDAGRTLKTVCDFLDADRMYVAEIYADAEDTDWITNPLTVDVHQKLVTWETELEIRLAPGGGQAVRFRPATHDETHQIHEY